MPITQKHAIVCDDVRQEIGGKWILIGVYTPDMTVPQIPFVLPTLSFFVWLESDRPGSFPFRMRLAPLESGTPIAEGIGMMQFARPGIGISVIRLGGIRLSTPGAHVFSIRFDGQADELLTQFSVILNVPPIAAQTQLPRQ